MDFPSSEQMKKIITELKVVQWPEYDGNDLPMFLKNIETKFFSKLKFMSSFYLKALENFSSEFKFFRARPVAEIKNIDLFCEYSYPIPTLVKRNNRANFIKHPVFYASDEPLVALVEFIQEWKESKDHVGKEFAISKWKINKPGEFLLRPFLSSSIIGHNEYAILADQSNEEMRACLGPTITDDQLEGVRLYKDFIAEMYITDKYRCISPYFAYQSLYNNHTDHHCIFMYPSTKVKFKGANFALHPNFVDENMSLEYIYKIIINDISEYEDGINFNYSISNDFGMNVNGKIKWEPIELIVDKFKNLYQKDWGQSNKEN